MLGQHMEREVTAQPSLLAANARTYYNEMLRAVADRKIEMILLAARGSSDHAALYARYLIEIHLGIPVSLAAPSVLTRYGTRVRYRNTLAVGISQSGAAPDVAEVMAMMRSEGHLTLGITNTPGSRLTKECEFSVLLNVDEEKSVAATKTYTATLLALYQMVRAAGGRLPEPEPHLPTDAWNESQRAASEKIAPKVVAARPLFSLGRGYGFSTACEAALKLMECALIPCKAYSTADFEHGPKALAGPGSGAIVFGEHAENLAKQGARILAAPKVPDTVPETLQPFWDILLGQWIALEAARIVEHDPDKPQFIQKVTETI